MREVFSFLITVAKLVRLYDGLIGHAIADVVKGLDVIETTVVRKPAASDPDNDRTVILQSADRNLNTKDLLKALAADIGAQVAVGKNTMVFCISTRMICGPP